MARLPTRDDLGPLPSARTGRTIARINPSVPDTSAIGRGMAQFGQAAARVGDTLAKIDFQRDQFETERRFQEFSWAQQQQLDQSFQTMQPGEAREFPQRWQQDYQKSAKQFFKEVPAPLRPDYENRLFGTEQALFIKASEFARVEQKRFSVNSIQDLNENVYRQQAREVPTEELDEVTAGLERVVMANPDLTPIEKDELLRQARRDIGLSHLDGMDPAQVRATLGAGTAEAVDTKQLLRQFEGFRAGAYFDVNAHRAGYGSDTVTRADGTVEKVSPGTKVSREDAERDLARRIGEFQQTIQQQVGAEAWSAMPNNMRAALTSVAYNYGSLPASVVKAVEAGDVEQVADAVGSLPANRNRRKKEAAIIRGAPAGQPAALAALTDEDRQRFIEKADREIEKAEKERQQTELVNGILGGGVTFNPYDKDSRKVVDEAISETGVGAAITEGDLSALQDGVVLSQHLGYAPRAVFDALRGLADSDSPQDKQAAYQSVLSIRDAQPNAFNAHDGATKLLNDAQTFQHYVDSRNMSPEKALERMRELETAEIKGLTEARKKSARDAAEDLDAGDITEIWDTWLPFDEPALGPTANDRELILGRFRDAFEEHFVLTGEEELAKKLASAEVRRTMGVSSLFGRNTAMHFPPESFYPPLGDEGHAYIEQQAIADVKAVAGQEVAPDRVFLRPDPQTRREAERYPRETVSYLLFYQDQDGLLQRVPGRFVADTVTGRAEAKSRFEKDRTREMRMQTEPVVVRTEEDPIEQMRLDREEMLRQQGLTE